MGSYLVPHARKFPLVSAFQPILGREHGTMCSFLQLFQADIEALLSGPKHVERPAKGKEEIQAMGHSPDSIEGTGNVHISWIGPHQLSGSSEFATIQSRL